MDKTKEITANPIDSLTNFSEFVNFWDANAQRLIFILVIVVIGIFLLQRIGPALSRFLQRYPATTKYAADATLYFYILFGYLLIGFTLIQLGIDRWVVRTMGFGFILMAIAISMLIRPYLPKLPFKVGNLIRTGDLLGKVEHISFLNTRLKTFDGLIVTVPNAKILNDYVLNYHTIPNRRIRVDVQIPLGQDVMRAKRLVEAVLVSDPRTLATPRPVVYVTNVNSGLVQIGGRAWVKNPKAWATRCEAIEKVMFAFEHANITIAVPEHQVNLRTEALPQDDMADMMLAQNN